MNHHFAWLQDTPARELLAAYAQAGEELRFVGGCVRDSLLRRPIHDLDACTPCLPERTIELLETAGIKTIPTGIEHGTVTAVIGGTSIEITTLRKDTSCDGRHAEVAFTNDYAEDAARRDFTMNALYLDAEGNVTDFFGGIEDAKAGRIKFIGTASDRIQEDSLRMLRLFRFYATHGQKKPDAEALQACKIHAEMLQQLSGERVQQEMLKLLASPDPMRAVQWLQSYGLAESIWQKIQDIIPLENLLRAEKMLQHMPDAILRLAALLEDADYVCERWKLSNRDSKKLHFLLRSNALQNEVQLKRAMVEHGAQNATEQLLFSHAKRHITDSTLKALTPTLEWEIPTFPVKGDDLLQAGITQGEALGAALVMLKNAWAESDYQLDKNALLAQLR